MRIKQSLTVPTVLLFGLTTSSAITAWQLNKLGLLGAYGGWLAFAVGVPIVSLLIQMAIIRFGD